MENGVLDITIRTELDGARSSVVNGSTQFARILEHFAGKFSAIKGNWSYGSNLADVNRLVGKGLSVEQAAKQTWTGQQAAKAGFTDVRVLEATKGANGEYTTVKVEFTKPATQP